MHPGVDFSSIKEVHYFSVDELYQRGEKYYHSFFPGDESQTRVSADTYLLIDKKAPERIKKYNPEMKFIVQMRHPVDRAYSAYQYGIRYGYENGQTGFLDTIPLEAKRMQNENIAYQNNMLHFYGSLYHHHLSFWMKHFDRSQFLLLTSASLKQQQPGTLQKVASFANINPFETLPEGIVSNVSAKPRSKALQQFLLNRDHPLRKALRWLVRPFRALVIRSGLVDALYRLNKKQEAYPSLERGEWLEARQYFNKDLERLEAEFNITFDEGHAV